MGSQQNNWAQEAGAGGIQVLLGLLAWGKRHSACCTWTLSRTEPPRAFEEAVDRCCLLIVLFHARLSGYVNILVLRSKTHNLLFFSLLLLVFTTLVTTYLPFTLEPMMTLYCVETPH